MFSPEWLSSSYSTGFNLDLVQILRGVHGTKLKSGARYRISSNFRGPKFCENVENQENVNFREKNFVIALTASPHVLAVLARKATDFRDCAANVRANVYPLLLRSLTIL